MSRLVPTISLCLLLIALPSAQTESVPTARLVSAPRLVMPDQVDSNVPMLWNLVDGEWQLSAFASWAGVPSLVAGPDLEHLQRVIESVTFVPPPGHGIWIEAVVPDESGTWYAYYHHEVPAVTCGRQDRSIPRIGAARSRDRGQTWENLGVILEAPRGSESCSSTNRYVIGGVGDLSVMLDHNSRDLYVFFSQYSRDASAQGIAVGRLLWADRDNPVGQVAVWHDGAWLPAQEVVRDDDIVEWEYASGTPLVPPRNPWHDGDRVVDAFWGPSVHWNTYLEQYVMLLNRARNEDYVNEGIYVSFSRSLDNPRGWSEPKKLMNGGTWYPQVVGLEGHSGTDKLAGQRARFFLMGRSDRIIEFEK